MPLRVLGEDRKGQRTGEGESVPGSVCLATGLETRRAAGSHGVICRARGDLCISCSLPSPPTLVKVHPGGACPPGLLRVGPAGWDASAGAAVAGPRGRSARGELGARGRWSPEPHERFRPLPPVSYLAGAGHCGHSACSHIRGTKDQGPGLPTSVQRGASWRAHRPRSCQGGTLLWVTGRCEAFSPEPAPGGEHACRRMLGYQDGGGLSARPAVLLAR